MANFSNGETREASRSFRSLRSCSRALSEIYNYQRECRARARDLPAPVSSTNKISLSLLCAAYANNARGYARNCRQREIFTLPNVRPNVIFDSGFRAIIQQAYVRELKSSYHSRLRFERRDTRGLIARSARSDYRSISFNINPFPFDASPTPRMPLFRFSPSFCFLPVDRRAHYRIPIRKGKLTTAPD